MARDTGFPQADAENDFLRARRHQVLSRLAVKLRGEPDDVSMVLPFDEVVAALGRTGETYVGLRVVPLEQIVGSVDRTEDFDRRFRPTSIRSRERWQSIATAQRRGTEMPPVDLYKVGDMYFVKDGHHRVSVALSLRYSSIEGYVTEVGTRLSPSGVRSRADLVLKDYRREFVDRVPLPREKRARIEFEEPYRYGQLSMFVEAWGFRVMQDEDRMMHRAEIARRWFDEEYVPVVRMLRQADLLDAGSTEADAYLNVANVRWQLIRSHEWSDEIVDRIRQTRKPRKWPKDPRELDEAAPTLWPPDPRALPPDPHPGPATVDPQAP